MGLPNRSVVLYQSIKIGSKVCFCAVDEDATHLSDGPFYVSWYDGKKKQMDPVGRNPKRALNKTTLKRTELAYIAVGGEIKKDNHNQNPVADSTKMRSGIPSQRRLRNTIERL